MFNLQCDEDDGSFNDDETPLMSYKRLVNEMGEEKSYLQIEMLKLRNEGLVALSMAVDYDYIPCGSGWMLTDNGVALCKTLFIPNPADA